MQLIFFFMLLTSAFAQHTCDPQELERECYSQVCQTTNPNNLVLNDSTELQNLVAKHPYRLDKSISANFKTLKTYTGKVKAAAKHALKNNELDKAAKEFLANPMEGMDAIEDFFKDDFKCIRKNHKCVLIVNSMNNYSSGMKELYKKFSDETYFLLGGDELPFPEKKKLLEAAFNKMEKHLPATKFQEETKRIKQLKSNDEYVGYTMDLGWGDDYKQQLAKVLRPYHKTLKDALEIKMKSLLELDISSTRAEAALHRSCQHASYLREAVNKVPLQKFSGMKEKMFSDFKKTFLPTLSASSATKLSGLLGQTKIVPIEIEENFSPILREVNVTSDKYERPESLAEFLSDVRLLSKGVNFRCSLRALVPKDEFQALDEIISISMTTVASGSADILTHEVGHWLDRQMEKKELSKHSFEKLDKIKACVKGFYPQDPVGSKVAEDFADWFITQMGGGENLVFCDLSKLQQKFKVKGPELFSSNDTLPHSNNLFRELHLRLEKGVKLSQNCKDLIEAHPDAQPRKCEY
jgi:hypothetical protein